MNTCVVMPAWNEAEGIEEFLLELEVSLNRWSPSFIVVDDCSSDDTAQAASATRGLGLDISVLSNPVNMGHGPSTVRGLRAGLDTGADIVVALDGDGQFLGRDVAAVVETLMHSGADLVEGVRTSRQDPIYRQAVTFGTRLLVWARVHQWPADANTPLRAYRKSILERLVELTPSSAATPNLLISANSRRLGLSVVEVPVTSRPRRGSVTGGSTWGKSRRMMPSRRFLEFCVQAAREWFHGPEERQTRSSP